MSKFKATVYKRGSACQHFYGAALDKLKIKTIAVLTEHEPGWGSIHPDKIVFSSHVRQIDGNTAEWAEVETVKYADLPEDQIVWKQRALKAAEGLRKKLAEEESKRCKCPSQLSGQLCTMGEGHAGPHQVGGPYHTVESFVTQCCEGECDYHPTQGALNVIMRWQQCIHCGHRKPLHVEQYLLETPCGAVELFAVDDNEAVHFALKYLAQTRVTTFPVGPTKLFSSLGLFRYPKEWVNRPTGGMIAIEPFVSALSTRMAYED